MKKFAVLLTAIALLFLVTPPCPATEQMSAESFQAMTPYGVPEAHDTSTTLRKKPAVFWGYEADGSVTFSDGTKQSAFNSSCTPVIILTVSGAAAAASTGYEASVVTYTDTGFTYQVRQNANGTVTDVTSTKSVHWVAFGWK